MNLRRWLWTAIGGLAAGIPGAVWAKIWHGRNPGEDALSVAEYAAGHGLMTVGVLVVLFSLAAAAGSVRHWARSVVLSTWVAFIGSALTAGGFAWDTARHFQETATPTPYPMIAMIYGGVALVVVGVAAALALSRGTAARATR